MSVYLLVVWLYWHIIIMCQYNQTTSNPCFSSGTVEQMKYSKLSLVSPGLGWHVFLSGSKSADKWRGSYLGGF